MAFYMIKIDDRANYESQTLCVKNKETALAVAKFVCMAMHGTCKSYDCNEAIAKYNRENYDQEDYRCGDVIVTELEVVG